MKVYLFAAGLAALTLGSIPARAADAEQPKWFARVAVTQLTLADDIKLNLGGAPLPGAAIDTKSHYTPTFHIGRFVTDEIALSLTGGLPPHIAIDGRGTLAPAGTLAEITYGPATAMVQYHVNRGGAVSPYAGIGACYMIVLDVDDGALQDAKVKNDLAPAVEIGAEFKVARHYGVFVEAKKAFLRTEASGTFGGAPVDSHIRLDPWAVSAGATIHF
jgi:outer membrane protein